MRVLRHRFLSLFKVDQHQLEPSLHLGIEATSLSDSQLIIGFEIYHYLSPTIQHSIVEVQVSNTLVMTVFHRHI